MALRSTSSVRLAVCVLLFVSLVAVPVAGQSTSASLGEAGIEPDARGTSDATTAHVDAAGDRARGAPTRMAELRNAVATAKAARLRSSHALDRRYVMSLTPDRPGEVRVRLRYRIPQEVTSLTATLPEDVTVTGTNGFARRDETTYEWTRSTREPSITYRVPVNETIERGREGETTGGYLYVATQDWAIHRAPQTGLTISGTGGRPSINTTYGFTGSGVTSGGIVYQGEYETATRTAAGQQLRLVLPAAADLRESRSRVLDTLAGTARTLEIGERDDAVNAIVAPTTVEWGSAGLQRGHADFYVLDDQRVATSDNVWIHEYVHTRQEYRTESETEWTTEGMAAYYAALLTYRQGHIGYDQFRRHLERGHANRYANDYLANPGTWRGSMAAYEKGGLVFAALDRRIRQNTERGATLQGAIRRFNGADGTVGQTGFLDAVGYVGTSDARQFARKHTETTASPSTWSQEEHLRVFRGVSFGYEFAPPYERTGPYRTDSAGAEPTVVTEETLGLRVAVENTGENAGEYEVVVSADGEPIAQRAGSLEAGGREVFTVERRFAEPGEVRVTAGGATERVTVRRPAELTVTALSAPRRAGVGRPVDVTATVGGLAFRPAAGTVAIRADDRTVAERELRLDSNETATVAGTVTFDEPGEYTVTAGDRSRTVRVVAGTPSGTTAPGTTTGDGGQGSTATTDQRTATATVPPGGEGPGFGVLGAVLALLALALVARRQ